MSDQRIKIPRASDKSLIACFRELADIVGLTQINVTALGFNNLGAINLEGDTPESLDLLLKSNSAIIEVITLNFPPMPIRFYRGGNYQVQEKSGVYDEIVFTHNSNIQAPPSEVLIKLVLCVNKKLKAFDPKRSGLGGDEEHSQFAAIHLSNIERLERLNEELISSTHAYRLELDREFTERSKDFEDKFLLKEQSLEVKFSEKEEDLKAKLDDFEQAKKNLEDKSNTHARREIRRDILKEIKSRQTKYSLTVGTNKLRFPVQLSMLGLIIIFFCLSALSAFEFYQALQGSDYSKIVVTGLKQTIYSAGLIGSVIFMIRWMNRWFELHSTSEFSLKQFELDMERASWLVETSLEWKDAKGNAIPSELLESLSRNLFSSDKQKVDHVQHPADQLASALLGSSTAIKLKAGDSYLEIDPKKLAKAKSIDASE